MKKITKYNFETLPTLLTEFTFGHSWGTIHPMEPYKYWTQTGEGVTLDPNPYDGIRTLNLLTEYTPNVSPYYRVGIIQTRAQYTFPFTVEAEILLPPTTGAWPAFWLYGEGQEIDILEGYNNNGTRYRSKLGIPNYNLQTNYHHDGESEGGSSHWVGKDVTKNFIKYSCHCENGLCTISYNNRIVKCYMIPNVGVPMKVILNNSIQPNRMLPPVSVMSVKSLTITEL